jgi:hypothetical protein
MRASFGLLVVASLQLWAADVPVFRGPIVLPIELSTAEGALPKGRYTLEVTHRDRYVLTFFRDGQKPLSVTGRLRATEDPLPDGVIPLMGAQFLRSSEDPLPTGQERQFSKTGAAQYEEEKRDWKGVVRVYKTSAGGVLFVFQQRREAGNWTIVDFELH